ncbi:MAG: hypothetical protein ACP5OG_03600 [Candidatus Nanoarchaeia archaeon]
MDLEVYLEKNSVNLKQEKHHGAFLNHLCNNLDIFGIKNPYKIFPEVRMQEKNENKEISFYSQSDLVILNSALYIIEAKVLRTDLTLEKELDKIRDIRTQLKNAYGFFKRNFKESPVLIGAYKSLESKGFSYYYQEPGGRLPVYKEILQVPCL